MRKDKPGHRQPDPELWRKFRLTTMREGNGGNIKISHGIGLFMIPIDFRAAMMTHHQSASALNAGLEQ